MTSGLSIPTHEIRSVRIGLSPAGKLLRACPSRCSRSACSPGIFEVPGEAGEFHVMVNEIQHEIASWRGS